MNKLAFLKNLVDPMAPRLGYLLRRASAAMMADLGGALLQIGLRPVEATILILVGANPDCIQSDLGRLLGIKRANMVPLILELEQRGFLKKSPVDGRSLGLTLTAAGKKACTKASEIMDAHEARIEMHLEGLNQRALRRTLASMAASAMDDEAP